MSRPSGADIAARLKASLAALRAPAASTPDSGVGVMTFDVPHHLQAPPADVLTMGAYSYNRPRLEWYPGDTRRITMGKFCCIHATVSIFVGGEHPHRNVTSYPLRGAFGMPGAFEDGSPTSRGDVRIENDVYVGFGATILSGVTLHNGCVVGAGAVVSRDVPAYAVVGGNPAQLLRWRFPEDQRAALERIAWWDWPEARIREQVSLLNSDNIAAFIERFDGPRSTPPV